MNLKYILHIILLHIFLLCNAEEYAYYPSVDMFYKFVYVPKNWYDAYAYCKLENASLAMPSNAEEAVILRDLFAEYPETVFKKVPQPHYILLGFHDLYTEGDYITLDGEHIQSKYHNWATNEPKHHVTENCGAMHRFGGLCDYPCTKIAPFICERGGSSRSERSYTIDDDYKSNDKLQKSYKLHMRLKTFGEAHVICKSEGADLAVIRSIDEEIFLSNMLNDPKEHVPYLKPPTEYFAFLGVHDMFKEGNFITVKDEPLSSLKYVNWGLKEPNGRTIQNCVALSPKLGMCDVSCIKKYMFFCEKTFNAGSFLDMRSLS